MDNIHRFNDSYQFKWQWGHSWSECQWYGIWVYPAISAIMYLTPRLLSPMFLNVLENRIRSNNSTLKERNIVTLAACKYWGEKWNIWTFTPKSVEEHQKCCTQANAMSRSRTYKNDLARTKIEKIAWHWLSNKQLKKEIEIRTSKFLPTDLSEEAQKLGNRFIIQLLLM